MLTSCRELCQVSTKDGDANEWDLSRSILMVAIVTARQSMSKLKQWLTIDKRWISWSLGKLQNIDYYKLINCIDAIIHTGYRHTEKHFRLLMGSAMRALIDGQTDGWMDTQTLPILLSLCFAKVTLLMKTTSTILGISTRDKRSLTIKTQAPVSRICFFSSYHEINKTFSEVRLEFPSSLDFGFLWAFHL